MTPEQHSNIYYELHECSDMLYFLTTSIVRLLETGEQLSEDEISGAQTCLFSLHDRLKSAITKFDEGAGK